MSSFGQDFAQGLSTGVSIYSNAQRENRQDQEQEWKAEDRQRETEERKQLDELGKVMMSVERGDLSPAVASANSSGQFGPDKFAAGARIGEDGFVYANVYDNKDPVNSMQEVKLGKLQDVKNNVFMTHAPPSVVAKLALAQAQKQMDPAYQQQLQHGELVNEGLRLNTSYLPIKQGLDTAHTQASINQAVTSTAATQQSMQQQALMGPAKLREAEAEAGLKERQKDNPYYGQKPLGYSTYEDPESEAVIKTPIYDPNDPRLRPPSKALGNPGQNTGAAPASQPTAPAQQPAQSAAPAAQAAPAAKTAAPTVDAKTYYQGLVQRGVSRDQAKALTLQKFGSK